MDEAPDYTTDPADETLEHIASGGYRIATDGSGYYVVMALETQETVSVHTLAREILRLRKATQAADELADEIENHNDDIGLQALGYVARYRRARGT